MGLTFRFIGTGSADGYPSPWCTCENCRYARSRRGRNLRRSTSVLVDQKVLIDFPVEVFILADQHGLDISAVDTLVITHGYTDHFHTSSFKWRCMHRRFGVLAAPTLNIHASDTITEAIRASLRFGPENECGISINTLTMGEAFDCH